MKNNLSQKVRSLALICFLTSFAGIMFQLINENQLDYNSVMFGLTLGLVFGFLELYLFPKADIRVHHWSFTKMLVIKTLLNLFSYVARGQKWSCLV